MIRLFHHKRKIKERWWLKFVLLLWLFLIWLAHHTEVVYDRQFDDALQAGGEE